VKARRYLKLGGVLLLVLLLASCATWTQTRQCSVGIAFFGPLPVLVMGCELIFEPEGDEGV